MNTKSCLISVMLLACGVWAVGVAHANPNSPEEMYRIASDNAGRSPLPQDGELFPTPLSLTAPEPIEVQFAEEDEIIAWDQAHAYLNGEAITVEGTIVDTYQVRDVVCRLNFDKQWQGKFYIAVFKSAYAGLPEPAAEYYRGKRLRVHGEVTMHRNQPNIEVRDLAQIHIVE